MTTELRLALAMRGGVSLAVWIGGSVAEIDLVRRASSAPPSVDSEAAGDDFWSNILADAAGYDRVVVDVLAGASAGGLNGVLYAASQVYDFPYSKIREVWLDVGGIAALVRKGPPWPSLLRGDEYFLTTVHEKLAELTAPPPGDTARLGDAEHPRPRVALALSATVMEPIVRPLPSPEDEPLFQRRHGSGFRFRQPEERWLPTDFPPPSDEHFADTLWRLAVAARSTSSFPVAFEGADVRSSRRKTFTSPPPAAGATTGAGTGGGGVDLDGTFLDRTTGESFVVADGGILDNIPIQCALDFIANAPAERPTERFLVYLQPGASTAGVATDNLAADERRTTLGVLRGVVAARVAGETINADIAAIEAYNEGIARAKNLRLATFAALGSREPFLALARTGRDHYRRNRASYEASEVFRLLLDPIGVLGEDPFPREVAGAPIDDDAWRSPIADWTPHDREGLETALGRRLLESTGREGLSLLGASGELGPLLRVSDLLIEWARWLEGVDASPAPSQAKAALHRIRQFLGSILDRSRRLAWVAAAASKRSDPAGFVSAATGALGRMSIVEPHEADATIDALRSGATGPLQAACHAALARVDQVVEAMTTEFADPDATSDLLPCIADLLVEVVAPLAHLDIPADAEDRHPGRLLHHVLRGEPVTIEVLEALDAVCLPEFVSGLPGRRRVDFRRMSTANRTPLAPSFAALLHAAADTGQWFDPSAKAVEEQKGIHVALKLAGNELANFSAFLLAPWRANDWLWGRLDAVPTLIDLLVRPGGWPSAWPSAPTTPRRWSSYTSWWRRRTTPGGAGSMPWSGLPSAPGSRWRCRRCEPHRRPTETTSTSVPSATPSSPGASGTSSARRWCWPPSRWAPCPAETRVARRRWRTWRLGSPPTAWAPRRSGATSGPPNSSTASANSPLRPPRPPSTTSPSQARVLPQPPRIVATAIRRVGPRLGLRLARGLVVADAAAASATVSRRKVLLGLAVAALVVLGVLGWYVDKWAFIIGFVVAFLPLGAVVFLLYRKAVRLLRQEPPPPPATTR